MANPKITGEKVSAAEWNSIGMFQIETIDLASVQTFSNIPQVYRDLRVEVSARSTTSAAIDILTMRVNGAATAAYFWQYWRLVNATTSGTSTTADTSARVGTITGASASADHFGNAEIIISEYASTSKRITGRSSSSALPSATVTTDWVRAELGFGFNSGNAVTSLTFLTAAAFAAGSRATLYGVGVA